MSSERREGRPRRYLGDGTASAWVALHRAITGAEDFLCGPVLRRVHLLVVAATASLALFLTACVEDLPDAQYSPDDFDGLTAHPEYEFLWKLGAPQPLPEQGYASLGRRITDMEQLIQVAHFVNHQGCQSPQSVTPALLGHYFPPAMIDTFSATVVCAGGQGDIIALMKPGHEAQFESAYRNVPDLYQARWKQAEEDIDQDCCDNNPKEKDSVYAFDYWAYGPIGVGNGFVVFEILHAVGHNDYHGTAWGYAGLGGLVCVKGKMLKGKLERKDGRPLKLRSAASAGCYLHRPGD